MTKRIGIVAVFLVGCAVGGASSQLVVPKASAQQAATLTKWEYTCGEGNLLKAATLNEYGAQGWELAVAHSDGNFGGAIVCFKRAKL